MPWRHASTTPSTGKSTPGYGHLRIIRISVVALSAKAYRVPLIKAPHWTAAPRRDEGMAKTKRVSDNDKTATADVLAYAERVHRLGLVAIHPALYVAAPCMGKHGVHDAAQQFGAVAYFDSHAAAHAAVIAARVAARAKGIAA